MSQLRRKRDTNYFEKVSVATTSFVLLANWNFNSTGIALMVESDDPADAVEYSFDGTTVHGDMIPFKPSEAIMFDNRTQSKIWFRRKYAGAAVNVRVEAWVNEA